MTCSSHPMFLCALLATLVTFSTLTRCREIPRRSEAEKNRLKFELDIKKGCDFIAFPNATLNECGFCVGADTGLEPNHGKDCKGVCFGRATVDCQGVCGGHAYVDECTGICIPPESATEAATSKSSANRDCRGLCLQSAADQSSASAPMPSHVYTVDRCGICRLSQSSFSSPNSQPDQPVDCNGNCQLPGIVKSSIVCGHCARPSELTNLLDDCGNCISEGHPCSCDRAPTKCGCIDPNNCYVIKTLSPGAIPTGVPTNVSIMGYFYPLAKQLYCVIRRQGFESVESFPVHFMHKNKTVTECTNVRLTQAGEYVLGLGFRKNVFITPPKDLLHLFVFDAQSVNISLVGPAKSLTNDSDSLLTIHFADLRSDIPPIPIKCKVIYESGEQEIGNFGVKLNSCTLRRSTRRLKSQKLKIYPTFDGVNLFPVYVEHLIEATAPNIFALSSFVSEDGLSIIVNFDKPVDLGVIERNIKENTDDEDDEPLVMCDYLLGESTIEHLSLYSLQSCRWATRIQLIITVLRPLASDSIEIELKPRVLMEHEQKYPLLNEVMSANISKLSNSINWWSYEPMVAITGPREISICGDFALIGHFASPRGTHEVDFQWEVSGEVSDELRQYVSRTGKSTNLILSADMLDIATPITFTFKAFVQARRQSLESTHTVTKLPFEAPMVSLYHTRLLHTLPLYESDNITIVADVKIPDCIDPPQRLILSWRVDDPAFLFPFKELKKRFAISYTVEPFSVPPNHPAALMLDAFIGLYQNETSTNIFRFEANKAPLKATLADGINKMTVGSHSGLLRISSQKDATTKPLVYQWSCHEVKSAQPCYFNFASVPSSTHRRSPVLLTREMQTRKDIYLDSSWFQPNQQYLVGLQVFDANNSKVSSETEYTMIEVVSGEKPQVAIGPVLIKGKFVVPYNTRFSTFLIPFGSNIVVRGKAYLETGIKSIRWESSTFRYPLSWSSKRVSNDLIETQLNIHDDGMMAYGVYAFKLIACSHKNECSSSEVSLMAAQSVVSCTVVVDSYVELELTSANVEKCSIAPSASPITYQLYLEDENFPTLLPITAPQFSPVMTFPGTPVFSENQLSRIAVRVCDRFDTCTLHFSQPVSVETIANLTASVHRLVHQARRLHRFGDSVNALSLLNSVFLKPDTLNESYRAYESAINATIDFGTDALQTPSLTLSKGHYEMIFNTLSFALLKTSDFRLRRRLLALIVRFYDKAEAMQSMPSVNSIRVAYSNVMNSYVPNEEQRNANITFSDSRYLQEVRAAFHRIKKAAASQLPLGSRLILVAERLDHRFLDNDGLPVRLHTAITEVAHLSNAFDVDIKARLSANQTVAARVQFGEEVKQNLSTGWDCKQVLPCTSVVYSVTMFPNENPFPEGKQAHRLSPVLDITIHAPRTGKEQSIKGLLKATVFELTVTGNESYGGSSFATKCHYFDEEQQEWRMDDVHPLGIAYNQAGCWSGHLSSFVVLRTVLGLNADYIIGVMVACLMGVLVFGIMLVFYVQRKREEASITPEVHKTVESSTVNGHRGSVYPGRPAKSRVKPSQVATEIQSQTILVTD